MRPTDTAILAQSNGNEEVTIFFGANMHWIEVINFCLSVTYLCMVQRHLPTMYLTDFTVAINCYSQKEKRYAACAEVEQVL